MEHLGRWLIEDLTGGGVFFALALFAAVFIGSLVVVGVVLVKLPATYFHDRHPHDLCAGSHPAVRVTARIGKNFLGVLLVLVGAILSLPGVPGPGILTILIGIMLLDFRGKRRLERRIISRPRILRMINRLRARWSQPVLDLGSDEPQSAEHVDRRRRSANG